MDNKRGWQKEREREREKGGGGGGGGRGLDGSYCVSGVCQW